MFFRTDTPCLLNILLEGRSDLRLGYSDVALEFKSQDSFKNYQAGEKFCKFGNFLKNHQVKFVKTSLLLSVYIHWLHGR